MQNLINKYRKLATLNCGICVLFSLLAILGWQFNSALLKSWSDTSVAMNPLTAVGFLLAAISLTMLSGKNSKNYQPGKLFAVFLFSIGLIRFIEILFHLNIGISGFLFSAKLSGEPGTPNVMAPNTAICFLIIGISLSLYRYKINKKNITSDYFAFIVTIISFFSILGYLYHSIELYKLSSFIPMALPTAISFFLVSTSILLYRSEFGFFSLFTRKYVGSKIARFLMPFAVGVPVLAGFLHFYCKKAGLISENFGEALFDTLIVLIFILLIWRCCLYLNKENKAFNEEMKKRIQAEEAARLNEEFLNVLIENLPEMVFVKDENLRFVRVNKTAEETIGINREELIGKSDYDFFCKEQADHFTKDDQRVFELQKIFIIPEEKIGTGENSRWLHTKKIVVEGPNQKRYLLGISQNITERKKWEKKLEDFNRELEQKVMERTEQLQQQEKLRQKLEKSLLDEKINHQKKLMQATIDGQENEKKQIGMELHDNINQILASTKLYIEIAQSDENLKHEMLTKSKKQINYAINEIRSLSKSLVPHGIETGGIGEGIKEIIETISLSNGIHFSTCISETALSMLDTKQQIAFYRIIQEQLNNILKHAEAKNVFIGVSKQEGALKLFIEDDGKGFDMKINRSGIGLSNIKSRIELLNGEMKMESAEGRGCRLEISFFTNDCVEVSTPQP